MPSESMVISLNGPLAPEPREEIRASEKGPRVTLYRSPQPVLTPESPDELRGTIANVVFPTGIDRRDDLGQPDRFDVYYGMADSRISVARLDLPEHLPASAPAEAGRRRAPLHSRLTCGAPLD